MPSDDYEPNYPESWDDDFRSIVDEMASEYGTAFLTDEHALDLISGAFYDMDITSSERDLMRAEAAFYFDDRYDIDIFDVWDWDDYSDWYDAA